MQVYLTQFYSILIYSAFNYAKNYVLDSLLCVVCNRSYILGCCKCQTVLIPSQSVLLRMPNYCFCIRHSRAVCVGAMLDTVITNESFRNLCLQPSEAPTLKNQFLKTSCSLFHLLHSSLILVLGVSPNFPLNVYPNSGAR